ncbi:MAG: hypothetical protein WCI12_02320, partial [Actinomycetes bacterium]
MPPPKTLGGRRRVVRIALILMVLAVAMGFFLSKIDTNQYSISPGGAEPVTSLITIDGKKGPAMPGKILLTDVYLTPLSWLTWLPAKLDPNVEMIPAEALVEPGVPPEQLDAQGYLQMAQSKDAARAAALTR